MKNLLGKSRKVGNAYLVLENGSWRYEILKLNRSLDKAEGDAYASAFCAVKSENTFGSFEYGDTYLSDIAAGAGISRAELIARLRAVEGALAFGAKVGS